jgi:hypothetical protein
VDIWGGIGRGMRGSSAAWSGACRASLAPYKVSVSSAKPLISPVSTRRWRFAAYLSFIPDRGKADHLQ